MSKKRVELPVPIEPLVQDWKGISTEIGPDGLVHAIVFDFAVYEENPGVSIELTKKRIRIIAYNRKGPHFDVQRSLDGLSGFEGRILWTREVPGGPLTRRAGPW